MIDIDSTLVHHFLEQSARRLPEKCALVHDGTRATYAEIDSSANCLANGLIADGVETGDRIVILLGNSLEYVTSYYGTLKSGAVAVPLNPELKASSLFEIFKTLEPKALILSGRQWQSLSRLDFAGSGVRTVVLIDERRQLPEIRGCSVVRWETLVQGGDGTAPVVKVMPTDLASIIFTSGSTGVPKGVMLTHRNIAANTDSIVRYLRLDENDIQMVVLPFFYVMGKSLLNTHFAVGGRVVINNRFAFPATVIKEMIDEQVTGFSGVPSTYAHLLHKSPLASRREQLGCLRYCSQAGGHMARTIKESLLNTLPEKTELFIMYGATEASARLSYVEPERLIEKIDSIGRPIPNVRMRVLGADGAELPCGQIGEIVALGANVTPGYWRDPEATGTALTHHGYHTGDLGYRDQDGYFFLVGRKDHQLKVGGHRVNPVEIEDALISTGLVVEAAVVGLPDPLLGHKLVALVVADGVTVEAGNILHQVAKVLPKFKRPQEILIVKSLPKHASGKIDREKCSGMVSILGEVSCSNNTIMREGTT